MRFSQISQRKCLSVAKLTTAFPLFHAAAYLWKLDKWLEDWEEDKSKSKEQERSNLLAKLGKPGSSKGRKREQEVTQKQKRSKRLQYQVLNDDWGEIVPPSLAGAECWLQWTTRGTRRWL